MQSKEYLVLPDGRKLFLDTPEEEARINAGIAADPDAHELTDEDFARMKPAKEFFDAKTYQALCDMRKKPSPWRLRRAA